MNNNSKRDISFFYAAVTRDTLHKSGKNKHDAISRKLSKVQLEKKSEECLKLNS